MDDAIAPTATCIAVNSRASTASCCGQTSGTALTACGQQKVHATRKTENPSGTVRTRRPRLHRAELLHRWCCRGTLQHHRGGSAPLPFHVGTLIGQRIQVSVSPSTTVACDWHSGWAWTTCDFAGKQESQRGTAALEAACSSISSAALPQARTSCRIQIARAAAACHFGFASAHDQRTWPLSSLCPCQRLQWSPEPKP